jgi:methyltransferase (TIGR00027 family)
VDAGQPSRTALATAAARAAHLLLDRAPWIFADTLARALLGEAAEDLIAVHREKATAAVLAAMRVAMTTRSRYAEDRLRAAVARGLQQYVLLGAGLDSFAYRSPLAPQLRVFEVDHPATQAWKRTRLAAAASPVPPWVRFVPVDFTRDALGERLAEMGFERSQPAFVSWLGVTQYLSEAAIGATLDVIGSFAPRTELVMEYLVPAERRDAAGQALAAFFMPRAAAFGEPWVTFLAPSATARLLSARGLVLVEDVGRKDQIAPWLWERADALVPHELGRLARAALPIAPVRGIKRRIR